ncbi:MAG: TrmH family RNA methyltransferase [Acidimicrobiales bacterium]
MAYFVPVDDPADERIADFTDLRNKDPRHFLVAEGALAVRHLIQSPYGIRSLLVTDRGRRALEPDLDGVDAPVFVVSQPLMATICGFNFHRGALAAADRLPLLRLSDLLRTVDGPVLVVEGVNDQENLGALFRNAAAFGAGCVVLDPTCTDPLSRRCIRVSVGNALRVPFTRADEWPGALRALQEHGYEVLALTPSAAAEPIDAVMPRRRQALLVGAEGPGLSGAALGAADRRVRVTLAGGVDSLNVATAAAIALHRLMPPG